MRVLFYGAGVLGSLYAGRVRQAGHEVTVLARGQRLQDIREHGIVLVDERTGHRTSARVSVIDELGPDDPYDLAVVLVRKNQLDSVLPVLAANRKIPSVLIMANTAGGYDDVLAALGAGRAMVGFPGAGGTREGPVVSYSIVPGLLQPTTVGELDGRITPRLRQVSALFRQAGFPAALSPNMDAWQKTHVALVSPIANAFYMCGGSNYALSKDPAGLKRMVQAIKEGFRSLESAGVPVTPRKMAMVAAVPDWLLVPILGKLMGTRWAELVMCKHANAARDEMKELSDEFKSLTDAAGINTPAIDLLRSYIP